MSLFNFSKLLEFKKSILTTTLVIMLGVTFIFWKINLQQQESETNLNFQFIESGFAKTLKHKINSYENALTGGRAFFNGSNYVSKDEWAEYIEALDIEDKYPGISGLGYIEKVPANELTNYTNVVRNKEIGEFSIYPDNVSDNYFIVKYIEPHSINKTSVGFNIASDKYLYDSVIKSIKNGKSILILGNLFSEKANIKTDLLMLLPIYEKKSSPKNSSERISKFTGFIYAQLKFKTLYENLKLNNTDLFYNSIYVNQKSQNSLIYSNSPNNAGKFSINKTYNIKQLPINIITESSQKFEDNARSSQPNHILFWGIILSLSFVFLLHIILKMYSNSVSMAKSATANLYQSFTEMQAVLGTIVDGIITIDELGVVQSFNPAAEQIFGYKANEVIGNNIKMLMPDRYAKNHDKYLKNYVETNHATIIGTGREVEAQKKDGTIFPMDLGVNEFSISGKRMFVGSIRDISARKKSEEEIRKKNTLLNIITASQTQFLKEQKNISQLFDNVLRNLLEISDSEYGFIGEIRHNEKDNAPFLKTIAISNIAWNKETNEFYEKNAPKGLEFHNLDTLFGYTIRTGKTVITNNPSEHKESRGLPEGHPTLSSYMGIPIYSGKILVGMIGIANREQGYDNEFKSYIEPLINTISSLIMAIKNEAERKKTNKKLLQYAEELEWQTTALEAARISAEESQKEAELANSLKSDFLATMSHEIRTPMNGIIGMTELLLDTDMTPKQESHARTVLHSADGLLQIINDILDFSKIEAGKLELNPIEFNLQDICEDVSELISVKTKEKAVELILNYHPNNIKNVIGDPVRVRQIILNLLGNAEKFTSEGYISIDVEQINQESKDDANFKISITDTGIGIPKKNQGKLFDKFSQADSSTTRKFGGTGLGLAICKQLVQLMGGEIGIKSVPNKGSKFWFTANLKEGSNEQFDDKKEYSNLKGLNVLIVDDLKLNLDLISTQLSLLDIKCKKCNNAEKAIEMMSLAKEQNKPYDMVLIDYIMPNINGEELAKQIRSDSQFDNSYLVMLSSTGSTVQTDKYTEIGFSGYIPKPIIKRQILKTMSIIWEKHEKEEKGFFISSEDVLVKEPNHILNTYFSQVNVLIAEDNRINQEFASEILKGMGCNLYIASNGVEAINIAKGNNIDILFMDVEMPVMNGHESAKKIIQMQESKIFKKFPIIALTASDIDIEKEECLKSGMTDFISKPLRKYKLQTILVKYLPKEKLMVMKETKKTISLKDKEILIAEDNRVNMELALELLNKFECKVTTARDGNEAIEKFKVNSPQIS